MTDASNAKSGASAATRPDLGTWACGLHGVWVEIRTKDGDTLRPCPKCPVGTSAGRVKISDG